MKDAKGHGSDARGAHSGGVQDIGHPVYNTAQRKEPGGRAFVLHNERTPSSNRNNAL